MESPLTFPCIFPIKVIGIAGERLEAEVTAIIDRHAPCADPDISVRASNRGKYLAITIRLRAENRQQLDDIYRDLAACKQVLMAL